MYALLGNLNTKFFCRNNCKLTNEYAADLIGKIIITRASGGVSNNNGNSFSSGMNSGWSEQKDWKIEPDFFKKLLNGGNANQCIVQTMIHSGTRNFINGEPHKLINLEQGG